MKFWSVPSVHVAFPNPQIIFFENFQTLLDNQLIPKSADPEAKVFYMRMKGDFHRYLAEIKPTEADGKTAIGNAKIQKIPPPLPIFRSSQGTEGVPGGVQHCSGKTSTIASHPSWCGAELFRFLRGITEIDRGGSPNRTKGGLEGFHFLD